MVTSSWVAPTPPEVNTKSWAAESWAVSAAITSGSSGIVTTRRSSIPFFRSSRASRPVFVSATLPERISLPMTRNAAVGRAGMGVSVLFASLRSAMPV